ncbi:hypothetical protein BDN71DRAFT_567911 [Pleurotus eryngii]|uniref:Uncharacterized protein n=1 Tax=Pleurotus eryngii TaxID=5323 RepID=A0A9P6D0S1_PLEER|nr:hypothetical protein BDN71DRAFT_567911 [Pleurotus eryngii]
MEFLFSFRRRMSRAFTAASFVLLRICAMWLLICRFPSQHHILGCAVCSPISRRQQCAFHLAAHIPLHCALGQQARTGMHQRELGYTKPLCSLPTGWRMGWTCHRNPVEFHQEDRCGVGMTGAKLTFASDLKRGPKASASRAARSLEMSSSSLIPPIGSQSESGLSMWACEASGGTLSLMDQPSRSPPTGFFLFVFFAGNL